MLLDVQADAQVRVQDRLVNLSVQEVAVPATARLLADLAVPGRAQEIADPGVLRRHVKGHALEGVTQLVPDNVSMAVQVPAQQTAGVAALAAVVRITVQVVWEMRAVQLRKLKILRL